ncbi:unnamed protein product [Paramecium sonneborni]|uniref:Uncharacterized protein n=1 Tax=Paramecium sonneborni TaxID=65129 RepID=A0A8S1MP24_9CILI|nr:unnamed protein product [Paramecium sonneborni]
MNKIINCPKSLQQSDEKDDLWFKKLTVKSQDATHTIWECEFSNWVQNEAKFVKLKITIILSEDKEIKYIQNGEIIRIDYVPNLFAKPQFFNNLEQLKNLQWQGNYTINRKKISKWTAYWNGEKIKKVGGYYCESGLKQGLWKELSKNYWSKAQIFEIGEYFNDQRRGFWKYSFQNTIIGGGYYNQESLKHGQWVELSDAFREFSEVTYEGEYNNGNKVGVWNIFWQYYEQKLQLGYGIYGQNNSGCAVKIGMWIELCDEFWKNSQIFHIGKYINGLKVGKWDIIEQWNNNSTQIGGGFYEYDENYGNFKSGKWIEICEGFYRSYIYSKQITYNGEYKKGKKVGVWDILWRKSSEESFIKIGGGSYGDDEMEGNLKFGSWIELSDKFNMWNQIIYNGQYKNNQKIGKWEVQWRKQHDKQFEVIGGGLYVDVEGNGTQKNGNWIEVNDNFEINNQTTHQGEYKNGKKIGSWVILYREHDAKPFEQIGGGQFAINEKQEDVKIGRWIELCNYFGTGFKSSQVIFIGDYQNDKKVGRWDFCWRKENSKPFEKIGGGVYDIDEQLGISIKVGSWIELSDTYGIQSGQDQVIFNGQYLNGKKVGIWNMMNRDYQQAEIRFQQIKEINYNHFNK